MKTSKLLQGIVVILLMGMGLPFQTFAGSPTDERTQNLAEKRKAKRVFVTGSLIPQNVTVKAIGTATTSPVRVYTRREMDRYGRFTTEGVLALDPSVRVVSQGPVNN